MILRILANIASGFSVFRRTVGRIRKFISLKPSAPQGKSFLKISAHLAVPELIADKQTDKLTDILLL